MTPVAKRSPEKVSVGGRKYALRRLSSGGVAEAEVIGVSSPSHGDVDPSPDPVGGDRSLLVPLVKGGDVVGREPLTAAPEHGPAAL
jgi:nicotinate phosphoribosyltransferase